MRQELDRVFEELEPPRGGLVDFRARIASDRRRRTHTWQLQCAAVVATVIAIAVVVFYPAFTSSSPLVAKSSPMAIRLGLADVPEEPVVVPSDKRSEMAAQRVAVEDERVVFYLVAPRISKPGSGQAPGL